MVEIEQEELERLKGIETNYNELVEKHTKLEKDHSTLKDEYIEMSRGQRGVSGTNKTDEFTDYCKNKFGK